jgi:hypothetical protein
MKDENKTCNCIHDKETSIGIHITLDIKGISHTLTIKEAREVYNMLGTILGNNSTFPNGVLRENNPVQDDYPWKFACKINENDLTGGNFDVTRE